MAHYTANYMIESTKEFRDHHFETDRDLDRDYDHVCSDLIKELGDVVICYISNRQGN